MTGKRRIFLVLLPLCMLFSSCGAGPTEVFDPNQSTAPDGPIVDFPAGEWVFFPSESELLCAEWRAGELCFRYRGSVGERVRYEQALAEDWYLRLPEQVAQNDRISTYLHPTGWRIAVYDNRRNRVLRERYGETPYVYELRIRRLVFARSVFPVYPESSRSFGLEEKSFDGLPDALPPDFFSLPENAILTRSAQSEKGLEIAFLTTVREWHALQAALPAAGWEPVGACYANADGDYFYTTYEPLKVQKEGVDYSYLPEDPDLRSVLAPDELPATDEEISDGTFCRIRLQIVRNEWVPAFWKHMHTLEGSPCSAS